MKSDTKTKKQLMLGNKAAARGLYEAGVCFASSYPGTPSTEITEELAKYDDVYSEWAPNEKVAMEAAFGASLAGKRSFAESLCLGHHAVTERYREIVSAGLLDSLDDLDREAVSVLK